MEWQCFEATENQMNEAMLTRLGALKSLPKFVDEPGTIYNRMRPEEVRRAAEIQLDDLIERSMRNSGDTPAKRFVLAQFRQASGGSQATTPRTASVCAGI